MRSLLPQMNRRKSVDNMKAFPQICSHVQYDCTGSFTEILPRLARGQREYGRSVDRRTPESNRTALGRFVFSSLAYHPRSVIARSLALEAGTWKRNLSLKLSERVSHVSRPLQVLFFFFQQLSSFSFSHCSHLSLASGQGTVATSWDERGNEK